jgi:hypothetical protein
MNKKMHRKQWDEKQYWRRLGVPSPPTNIFFGSTLEQMWKGVVEFDRKTFKNCGLSYGLAIRNSLVTK